MPASRRKAPLPRVPRFFGRERFPPIFLRSSSPSLPKAASGAPKASCDGGEQRAASGAPKAACGAHGAASGAEEAAGTTSLSPTPAERTRGPLKKQKAEILRAQPQPQRALKDQVLKKKAEEEDKKEKDKKDTKEKDKKDMKEKDDKKDKKEKGEKKDKKEKEAFGAMAVGARVAGAGHA